MLEIQRFYVEHFHLWHRAEFYTQPGIILISGANKSGKTLLFHSLNLLLRAQTLKRGSSLSRVPKKSQLGLEFKVKGEPWHIRLNSNTLHLNAGNVDQGSTGKLASRQLLESTLAMPTELFESAVHIQGRGDHPLVSASPLKKMEWFASVLDLTDAYDRALVDVQIRLGKAQNAATQLNFLENEANAIVIGDEPDLEGLQAKLNAKRLTKEIYDGARRLLDTYDSLEPTRPTVELEQTITEIESEIKQMELDLSAAEAYEASSARTNTITKLEAELDRIPPDDASEDVIRTFLDVLNTEYTKLCQQNSAWIESSRDRERYTHAMQSLEGAPSDIREVRDRVQARYATAAAQLRTLENHRTARCPVCEAELSPERRNNLIERNRAIIDRDRLKITQLQEWEQAEQLVDLLQPRIECIVEPPPPEPIELTLNTFENRYSAQQLANQLRSRLEDLRSSVGTDLPKPEHPAQLIRAELNTVRKELTEYQIELDRSLRLDRLDSEITEQYGELTFEQLRYRCEVSNSQLEDLIVQVTQATNELETIRAARDRLQLLETQMEALRRVARRLPELLELKEALGNRGLRLAKTHGLALAFQAEFNRIVPLLWDEPFHIDIEIKHNGLEIYATRNGEREDLHSLSGSEMNVWKMLVALCLARLMPDRLRCNTVILDEVEAHLDEGTRERFVSEYLPALKQHVECVILVSPQNYRDSSLTPDATYNVVKSDFVSRLERMS